MTRPTLTEQIRAIEFSDAAALRFLGLVNTSHTEEGRAVILAAAATLLEREHPGRTEADELDLVRTGSEFIQLMFEVRNERLGQRPATPGLRIVGGTDV